MNTIYGLTNENGHVRYIGKTSKTLQERLQSHLKAARNVSNTCHRANWIRACLARGVTPRIVEIQATDSPNEDECFWIWACAVDSKMDLTNGTAGGDGGVPTDETRRKIAEKAKGRPSPNKGKPMSDAQKELLRQANKGKAAPNKGVPATGNRLAALKRNHAAKTGVRMSEEARKKMSESRKGRKHSAETRAKMCEANRKAWAKRKGYEE